MNPHYYAGDTYNSRKIELNEMTKEEIEAYRKGYEDNMISGEFKDWG
jgi:hypothetical protein